ncbi:MAG: arsinothricin resistance N-acetyltransferase ArsN1 family B [Myxococcota bacterium]
MSDLVVRDATLDDAAAIQRIYAPYVRDTTISFELEPPTLEQMAARIEKALRGWAWLVAEVQGAVVGYAYASQHRERAAYAPSVDVAVYLEPGAHRRGLGRALYGELFARLKAQGRHMAFAGIAQPNEASVRLHQALGFTLVGTYREVGFKFGRYLDVSWWQRPV